MLKWFKKKHNVYVCPRCGKELEKETDSNLKKDYPYVCKDCDENFFEFEAVILHKR